MITKKSNQGEKLPLNHDQIWKATRPRKPRIQKRRSIAANTRPPSNGTIGMRLNRFIKKPKYARGAQMLRTFGDWSAKSRQIEAAIAPAIGPAMPTSASSLAFL